MPYTSRFYEGGPRDDRVMSIWHENCAECDDLLKMFDSEEDLIRASLKGMYKEGSFRLWVALVEAFPGAILAAPNLSDESYLACLDRVIEWLPTQHSLNRAIKQQSCNKDGPSSLPTEAGTTITSTSCEKIKSLISDLTSLRNFHNKICEAHEMSYPEIYPPYVLLEETQAALDKMAAVAHSLGQHEEAETAKHIFYNLEGEKCQKICGLPIELSQHDGLTPLQKRFAQFAFIYSHDAPN